MFGHVDVSVILSMIDVAGFALKRVSNSVSDDTSSSSPFQRRAEVQELRMTCDRLVAKLCNVKSQCNTWSSLAPELGTKTINSWAPPITFTEECSLLQGHIFLIKKKNVPFAFVRNVCRAKVGLQRAQLFFPWFVYSCDKAYHWIRFNAEANCVAAVDIPDSEVGHFLRGLLVPWLTARVSISLVRDIMSTNVARQSWMFSVTWRKTCKLSYPVAPFLIIIPSSLIVSSRAVRIFCFLALNLRQMVAALLCRRRTRFSMQDLRAGRTRRPRLRARPDVLRNIRCGLGLMMRRRLQTIFTI